MSDPQYAAMTRGEVRAVILIWVMDVQNAMVVYDSYLP